MEAIMQATQRIILAAGAAMGLAAALQPLQTQASDWPQRTVKFVVPSPPGSSIDLAARVYAERLAAKWNRSVVVENNPGATASSPQRM
jgi:tripartite-type tricarboxylate transporter receptor subunit TctC